MVVCGCPSFFLGLVMRPWAAWSLVEVRFVPGGSILVEGHVPSSEGWPLSPIWWVDLPLLVKAFLGWVGFFSYLGPLPSYGFLFFSWVFGGFLFFVGLCGKWNCPDWVSFITVYFRASIAFFCSQFVS